MKQLGTLITLLSTSLFALAQTYGNEWIDYTQDYYKFQVAEDGVYRITFQDLQNAGLPVSSINPKNISLYKNGEEQLIYVKGEGDGSLDNGDFIEFVGTKNRGELDEALFRSVGEHTNPYVSLYTDTAAYFLTWSTTASTFHLAEFYDNNYAGKTPDSYFTYETIAEYGGTHFAGVPNNNNPEQTFSEYTDGEGYMGNSLNALTQHKLSTPAPFMGGPNAQLELKAFSRNNPKEFENGFNHGFGIALGTKSNLLKTIEHNGYSRVDVAYTDLSISSSSLSDETIFFFGEVSRPNSYHNVAYAKLKYARRFDLQSKSMLKFNTSSGSTYYEFSNYRPGGNAPVIVDQSAGLRINGDVVGGSLKFNTATGGATQKEFAIYDESDVKSVSTLREVSFNAIPQNGANYLLISHPLLASSAQEYADYRTSAAGGNHLVTTIMAPDLYDQFYYGIHHPLAIRNAIYFMLDRLNEPLENILILGKGQTYTQVRYNPAKRNTLDLIPTMGTPPTDYLFVSPLDASDMNIRVPIGRVAAQNNTEVRDYLNKVKVHESVSPAEWQKKIIQVIGGSDEAENKQFRSYVDAYFKIASDTCLGAYRKIFSKEKAVDISVDLIDDIQAEVDRGATIFNYFGHGSAQVLEVAIGEPQDLDNYGKYPFFIFNGCALGNCYVDISIGEGYLFEPDDGAVSWMASTGFGFTSELLGYTRIFHEELLQKKYNESIGKSIKSTISRYQNKNDNVNVQNCRQLVYQGDPAIRLNNPKLPDVTVRNGKLNSDFSFRDKIEIDIDLYNLGKTSKDTVTLVVKAQNSDSTTKVFEGRFPVPKYLSKETLSFEKTAFFSGLVKFTIQVDPTNKVDELQPDGEVNNTYVFEQLFELKKPLLIYPKLNSIVHKSNVDFVFQIVNSKKEDIQINIQLDTTPDFTNDGIAQHSFTTNKNLVEYSIALPPLDGYDFFYRIKTVQNGDESDWSTSVFAYLYDKSPGWSESHYNNLLNLGSMDFVLLDSPYTQLEFGNRISNQYKIETNGVDEPGFNWNIFTIAGEFDFIWNFKPNGIRVVAFDPNTEKRFHKGSTYELTYPPNEYWPSDPKITSQEEYYVVGNNTGVHEFKTNTKAERDSLLAYLKSIPDGYHIMLHNERNTGIEDWEDALFDELARFGITNLKGKKEGEPFALFGTKGDPNQSLEKYADYSSTIPATEQKVELAFNIFPKVTDGSITSEEIGPASSWSSVEVNMKDKDSPTDHYKYHVYGVESDGDEQRLFSNITTNSLDISSVDPAIYPKLKLQLVLSDSQNYTPQNIDRWTVFYEGVTEGAIVLDEANIVSADTVQEGDLFSFETAFKNISTRVFDTSETQVRLIDENGITTEYSILKHDTIAPGNHITLTDTIETLGMFGRYQMYVAANYNRSVEEDEYKNNLFYKEFYVKRDFRNPFLDVTFDGVHILNNDIVSANTVIVITGKDENPFLFLDDPDLFEIKLRYPNKDTFITISQMDPMFEFTPSTSPEEKASITINTMDLQDGKYTLTAKLMDQSENGKNSQPYSIDFQVINKKSISNIYPYPNPFTSCAKFVFTCTGNEVPDKMRINIYTITGRLVKQIDETELGPIRIGNNVTEYCWDGTDDFGDRLANGVYLYKADIYSNGEKIDLFETSADHLFNNGFGKLYIAR